jgi:hypothetical protein
MRKNRVCLGGLAALAALVVPVSASAQSTPVDQPFVIANNVSIPASANTMTAALTPSAFGCSGSQQFYVRSFVVSAHEVSAANGGYFFTVNVSQAHTSGPPTSSPLIFSGSGGSTALFAQTFMLSSVGAPVSSISIYKVSWAATFNIVAWGYCGPATTLGTITWKP